ncbi:Adiponectin receptor protein [Aphelenchoides bicaudatus]|nr:Adiponectin receptor protein [Aphelenchoides bicaudatus]
MIKLWVCHFLFGNGLTFCILAAVWSERKTTKSHLFKQLLSTFFKQNIHKIISHRCNMSTPPNRKKSQPNASEDFVSSDVNRALQEAREIITNKGKQKPDHHLIEESTTVQVKNFGKKNELPVEVYVTRSTKTAQDTDEEEEIIASFSDSELRNERAHSFGNRKLRHRPVSDKDIPKLAKEEGEKPFTHHTNARYRRKRDEMWTRDDTSFGSPKKALAQNNDDARLEVDVVEETREVDGGVQIETVWSIKWTVQNFDDLPDWLKDNEFLLSGHRPPLPSVSECFKSIFQLHTETGNIWTHLIGCLAFFFLAVWFLTRPDVHIQFQEKIVFSFFFIGAILCLGLSFAFHTLSCHSVPVLNLFSKLDYTGISLLIVGSFVPWIYYGFYCRREPKITYIAMICVLGAGAVVVSLWDKFNESRFRALRAGVFVSMACSGIIPAIHFVYTDGMRRLIDENGFYWLLTMAFFYLVGAFLYATRIPERFWPGKCDLVFQSHQLFHMCVVVAAFVHFYGISEMAMNKLTNECPIDGAPHTHSMHNEL